MVVEKHMLTITGGIVLDELSSLHQHLHPQLVVTGTARRCSLSMQQSELGEGRG